MRHAVAISLLVTAATLTQGCATARREPLFVSPDFYARDADTVYVAPVVEERAFPETQVPLVTYVTHAAERVLQAKGYIAETAPAAPLKLDVSLLDAGADDLLASASVPGRWVLWIALERVDTDDSGIGLDTRVGVAGVLLDSEKRAVLWRDRVERESSISGAGFATISPSVRTYEAVHAAVQTLLASLPDRPD